MILALVGSVLLIDLLTARSLSFASAVALTVLAFVAAPWRGAIVVGAVSVQQPWIRSAVVVWQVLQLAIGAGAISGALQQSRPRVAAGDRRVR